RGLGRSSRLFRALVDGEIASSVSASYELTLDPYLFTVDATLRSGVEPARAEAAILKELERIQREGVPEDELARTKRQLHAQVVYSLEGVTNQGFALGFMDLVARRGRLADLPAGPAAGNRGGYPARREHVPGRAAAH